MNIEPTPTPLQVANVSKAIAVQDWPRAFKLMDKLVGWECAGRWLIAELDIAGVIPPKAVRDARPLGGHGQHRGPHFPR